MEHTKKEKRIKKKKRRRKEVDMTWLIVFLHIFVIKCAIWLWQCPIGITYDMYKLNTKPDKLKNE